MAFKADDAKLTTKDKLISSAVELFADNWYGSVSVAEICRNCELSNGVFYRYFKSKEELIRQVLEGFLDVIETRFQNITGEDVKQRLDSFFSFILDSNNTDQVYISIFREGEYRFPEYEKRLRNIYLSALQLVYAREVRLSEYLYIVGSIRFLIRRPCFKEQTATSGYLTDLVYNGIFCEPDNIDFNCLTADFPPASDNPEDADTKTKLILSGKQLIAELGFHKVNIFEITRNAGFAVGTFYIHFSSKSELFEEVVLYLGRQLRHYISSNLTGNLNRIEQELQGWMLFLKYFEMHSENYELVREAEFIVRDTAREYYNRFETGYRSRPEAMRIQDKTVAANFLMGIAHFIGIEVFYSRTVDEPQKLIESLAGPLVNGIKE